MKLIAALLLTMGLFACSSRPGNPDPQPRPPNQPPITGDDCKPGPGGAPCVRR